MAHMPLFHRPAQLASTWPPYFAFSSAKKVPGTFFSSTSIDSGGFSKLGAQGGDMYGAHIKRKIRKDSLFST